MGELQHHEIEGLLRSAAMAPLSQETTRRVLIEYQALLAKHRELRELLERLTPALGGVAEGDERAHDATRRLAVTKA